MIIRIILLVLAYLLLAAHFLRIGNLVFVLLCFLIPFLLLIKKRWSLNIVQISLFIGTLIWIRTAINIIDKRRLLEVPWRGIVMIIGPVALLTLLAGLLLYSPVVRKKYPRNTQKINQDEDK